MHGLLAGLHLPEFHGGAELGRVLEHLCYCKMKGTCQMMQPVFITKIRVSSSVTGEIHTINRTS